MESSMLGGVYKSSCPPGVQGNHFCGREHSVDVFPTPQPAPSAPLAVVWVSQLKSSLGQYVL